MIARKCDRCGKFYDYYNDYKQHGNMLAFMKSDLTGTGKANIANSQYDLCEDCMKSVIEYAEVKS